MTDLKSTVQNNSSKTASERSHAKDLNKEVLEYVEEFKAYVSGDKEISTVVYILLLGLVPLTFVFSAFLFIVPLLHGIGGWLLHKNQGWKFYQPGKGGSRFMALNGVGWFFFASTLLIQLLNIRRNDLFLSFSAFMSGLISISFIFSSLLAFQTTASKIVEIGDKTQIKKSKHIFIESMQDTIFMSSGQNPSSLFWVLIGFQLWLCFTGAWFLMFLAFAQSKLLGLQVITVLLSTACFTGTTPLTYVIGGKWKNFGTNFTSFQPFRGGRRFVVLQAFGWTLYGFCQYTSLMSSYYILQMSELKRPLLALTALFGLSAEIFIILSLFVFEGEPNTLNPGVEDRIQTSAIDIVVGFANLVFCPSGDWKSKTRKSILKSEADWEQGEQRLKKIMKQYACDIPSGEQYLIVGCGFVGKRIVKRLLERGETKIRIFDLNPNNPFPNEDKVEYFVGNVTNFKDIYKACKGVDTVFATFALIRFMDRLQHQAALSYLVNVVGTEVMFDAIFESADNSRKTAKNPMKVVVTSSSHATTDEFSLPRRDRTEKAAYVTEETAHNHYGWTKALADKYALKEGSSRDNVKTTVIRPCSGVFGGDDRTSLQKCLHLGVAPGIGNYCEMDWVYVENVVLGHLLAEQGLQKEIKGDIKQNQVSGQAFNISNNDPTTWIDFWYLVQDTILKTKIPLQIKYVFVPMSLIWAIAYLSEGIQWIFRGKLKLGEDLDSLTPAMLQTATMSYTYQSEKASQILGYSPAYSLDEGVQKSVIEYQDIIKQNV